MPGHSPSTPTPASPQPGPPGLPGPPSAGDPGTDPVVDPLLDDLLCDAVPAVTDTQAQAAGRGRGGPVAAALAEHREHRASWYGDLMGPLRVAAPAVQALVDALQPGDHALGIVLTPDPTSDDPVADLRAARTLLLDDHRVELAGVELPFFFGTADQAAKKDLLARSARKALDELDFSVPAWFMAPALPGWEPAYDVLAQDGAESLALFLPMLPQAEPAEPGQPGETFAGVAGVLRALIDRELPFAVPAGVTGLVTTTSGYGLLNLLVATRAALNGAGTPDLAAILAEAAIAPLAGAVRRMSDADAAIVRAFLPTIGCASIRDLVQELTAQGLIVPDAG